MKTRDTGGTTAVDYCPGLFARVAVLSDQLVSVYKKQMKLLLMPYF